MSTRRDRSIDSSDPVKLATLSALRRVLDPLLELMFDAGVTVPELNTLARIRAVRVAAKRIKKELGRESISRVAILIGLPRSEVGRILKSDDSAAIVKSEPHRARRILARWHESPNFRDPSGLPADLPIFGRARSFQNLVERHGGGIPVRAMLDELTRVNAISLIEGGKVRAIARVPKQISSSNHSIIALGERVGELLETLTYNLQPGSQPMFEGTAQITALSKDTIFSTRALITERGRKFINDADAILNRTRAKTRRKNIGNPELCRFGVTVYCFQEKATEEKPMIGKTRKNLRRKHTRAVKLRSSD